MKKHPKLKRIIICIAAILGSLLILATVIYINLKSFTVKKMQSKTGQEVYLMGTFHKDHFDSLTNYSVEEMLNAIENIDPDAVFIEAREESYAQFGVVDGPVDMCIAYCYCRDNDIPVEMVDYWKVDNDNYKQNTTTDDRDDNIHQRIMEKLGLYENKKVLVWTVNEEGSQKYFLCSRVDGIITDNVSQALKLFGELEDRSDLERMIDKIKTLL